METPRLVVRILSLTGKISTMSTTLARNILEPVQEALNSSPVVLLLGPRQSGKSTALKMIAGSRKSIQYVTFDDATDLASAKASPQDYILSLASTAFIDEVQRVPEVFLPIKLSVDRHRKPGRFLLTGSSNILLLPRLAEALVGRMQIMNLWPLSQGEIEGREEHFIDAVFSTGELPGRRLQPIEKKGVLDIACRGGFPEPALSRDEAFRTRWYGAYITTVLQREVRDLSNVERLPELPNLLQLMATRACGLLNAADLASESGMPYMTLKRYMALLQAAFLHVLVPAWSPRSGKRLTKAPKIYFPDAGLLSYLLGICEGETNRPTRAVGQVIENFVVCELLKQIEWNTTRVNLCYFRTHQGREVDILLENRAGQVVGIEVKSAATATVGDFSGLRYLQENYPSLFLRGIVLYCGERCLPFGERLHAVPISALWQW